MHDAEADDRSDGPRESRFRLAHLNGWTGTNRGADARDASASEGRPPREARDGAEQATEADAGASVATDYGRFALPRLGLVEPLTPTCWLGRSLGRSVAARLVARRGTALDPALQRRIEDASALAEPALAPLLGLTDRDGERWVATVLGDGLPLGRLADVARLAPEQAAAVVLDVADGLTSLSAAALACAVVDPDDVWVAQDGRARLDPAPAALAGRPVDRGWPPDALSEVAQLLLACIPGDVGPELGSLSPTAGEDNAATLPRQRRAPTRQSARAAEAARRHRLERRRRDSRLRELLAILASDGADPATAPQETLVRLHAELATADLAAIRLSLGALVAATRSSGLSTAPDPVADLGPGLAPSAAGTGQLPIGRDGRSGDRPDGSGPSAPVVGRQLPQHGRQRSATGDRDGGRLPGGTRRPRVWQRPLAIAIAVVVTAVALGVELVLLLPRVVREIGALSPGTSTAQAAPVRPTSPALRAVPTLAPRIAGAVQAVDVRPLRSCTPGSTCPVRVVIALTASNRPTTVSWSVAVVDRCTGRVTRHPEGRLGAARREVSVVGYADVAIPKGHPVALVAVTSTPAAAASRAVPVPATGRTCPRT